MGTEQPPGFDAEMDALDQPDIPTLLGQVSEGLCRQPNPDGQLCAYERPCPHHAADPATVVGTPPWQVHNSPPHTHGTPAEVTADRDAVAKMLVGQRGLYQQALDMLAEVTVDRDRLRQRLADSIDPATIPNQQAKNWPDWHPEKYCHRCGQLNINWYADSAIWNEVHGGSGPIWCPVCFVRAYEQTTGRRVSWRLAPVEKSDQLGHLIRSEAAMRHERDAARAELATARVEIARLTDGWRTTDHLRDEWRQRADDATADLQAALVTIGALRDELATARRDAAAEELDLLADGWSCPGDVREERRRIRMEAADVRAGQRTIPTQPATTGTDTTEET
jgi:hypothetical protein